ncbi:TetR/AcrR family transcriptional regulator [Gordonia neofelifaecis]|uniref:TetR family transcriptional regulator n=1 Tax=Gordonia neofelifaecis NRRL B-59395 TaxID=644548 RepID=F1YE38_9ACTN|nr:TetR/AcrR family transcriptional regulator [Gordonia neofelifaecis]EGD57128.1 TetR family transcriptional regulator [Gordonia neofelifaecis NRRL B-59395]
MQNTEPGLRERQRVETLRALRTAAVDLVCENGLSDTTVAEIADRAGVSRRTFFNYYACKEDAVLGAGPPTIPERALKEFVDAAPGPDRLDRAVSLVIAVAASIRQAGGPHSDHRELVRKHPALIERMQQHGTAAQELLTSVIAEQIGERAGPDAVDDARALIMLAGTVLRFAYQKDPDVLDNPDAPALTEAGAVFRRTIKELS